MTDAIAEPTPPMPPRPLRGEVEVLLFCRHDECLWQGLARRTRGTPALCPKCGRGVSENPMKGEGDR